MDSKFYSFQIALWVHKYFLWKCCVTFETIVLILSGKRNIVTPYHYFHHAMMPIMIWFVCKFTPGGHAIFACLTNSFIHLLLYSFGTSAMIVPWIAQFRSQFYGILTHLNVSIDSNSEIVSNLCHSSDSSFSCDYCTRVAIVLQQSMPVSNLLQLFSFTFCGNYFYCLSFVR